MGGIFLLLLASLEGLVHAEQPIMVAKSLGLERLSESYLLSEKVEQALIKAYGVPVGILSGNPCTNYKCQIKAIEAEQTHYLILIELTREGDQYTTSVRLYDSRKKKIRYNKKIPAASLTELMENLPDKVVQQSKPHFSALAKEMLDSQPKTSQSAKASDKPSDTKDPQALEDPQEETLVDAEASDGETTTPPNKPPVSRAVFDGFRMRAGGMLLYNQFTQKADVIGQDIASDVSFATILPSLYAQGELRFSSIPLHVHGGVGVDAFGTTYADNTNLYTLSQFRFAALYYKALSPKLILEGGLSYGTFSSLSYIFESARTSVGSVTQDKAGVGIDVALLAQIAGFDVRVSLTELLEPMPIQTQGSVLIEWPAGTLAGFQSSFHAGIHAQMRHFTVSKADEEAAVNNLQVGLLGGYGIWF